MTDEVLSGHAEFKPVTVRGSSAPMERNEKVVEAVARGIFEAEQGGRAAGAQPEDHFADVKKMVRLGSGAE